MGRARWVGRAALVAALLASAGILFVILHGGGPGEHVCNVRGSGGPGTLSLWPPGTRCWLSDEGSEPGVVVSGLLAPACAGTWVVLAGVYVGVRRLAARRAG